MRYFILVAATSLVAWSCSQSSRPDAQKAALATRADSISYSLGINLASQLRQEGLDEINEQVFARAVADRFVTDSLLIGPEQAKALLSVYFKELKAKQLAKHLQQGRDFLQRNAKRKGVKTLSSGVQYEVVEQGQGESPRATQNVKCHYRGMLLDSTVFESTIESGSPVVFPVNGVIPGLGEALQQMAPGARWRVYIPTELAYGEKPYPGGLIKPNMALMYEIELLSIEPN